MQKALTIFQINDTHGYLEPHPELVWISDGPTYPVLGGYARIASLLKQARADNPDGVIALDNGDTFHGTYPAVISKGEVLVPLVNALQLDAMTAHWEFAWGPQHFQELTQRLNHPVLAINCYEEQSGNRPFQGSIVLHRLGLRVGVIGIAATIIDKSMPPRFSEGLRFTSGIDELPAEIARLRSTEGVHLIVVLSHLGFPQDVKLAQSIDGIDVVVSGHTHNRLDHPARIRETLIIQSGCHGSFVGKLDLDIESGSVSGARHRIIPVDEWHWFQFYQARPVWDPDMQHRITMSWDTASKVNELANYSVGQTWHRTPKGYHLVGLVRRKLDLPDLKRLVINEAEDQKARTILIEDKGSGIGLIQELRRTRWSHWTPEIIPIVPKDDKVMRLHAQTPKIEAGQVFLPARADWLEDFKAEVCAFPNGSHDDQVDAMSQYLQWEDDRRSRFTYWATAR